MTNLWGAERVGNSIQILHMFYGIGALFCPAFVRIFLLPIPDELIDNYEAYKNLYKPEEVQIKWPFFTFGIPSIVIGFCFLYYYFNDPYSVDNQGFEEEKPRKSVEGGRSLDFPRRPSNHSRWKIYLAVFCILGSCYGSSCFCIGWHDLWVILMTTNIFEALVQQNPLMNILSILSIKVPTYKHLVWNRIFIWTKKLPLSLQPFFGLHLRFQEVYLWVWQWFYPKN